MIKEFKVIKKKKRWCRINGKKYDMNAPEVESNIYNYYNAILDIKKK